MHVPAVGSRSSSLAIWTLWMEMSGLRHLNPNRGGRLQDVMKRRSPARWLKMFDAEELQTLVSGDDRPLDV